MPTGSVLSWWWWQSLWILTADTDISLSSLELRVNRKHVHRSLPLLQIPDALCVNTLYVPQWSTQSGRCQLYCLGLCSGPAAPGCSTWSQLFKDMENEMLLLITMFPIMLDQTELGGGVCLFPPVWSFLSFFSSFCLFFNAEEELDMQHLNITTCLQMFASVLTFITYWAPKNPFYYQSGAILLGLSALKVHLIKAWLHGLG